MNYWLKMYDENLIKFSMQYAPKGYLDIEFLWEAVNKKVFPVGVVDEQDMVKWLYKRIIPKNREYVHQILTRLGLRYDDVIGIINTCKGLSLNDSYWVVPEDFEGNFAAYNLYENKFSEILSLIALTGRASSWNIEYTTSPELTTNGMLPKTWRNVDGEITLFKGGFDSKGLEPYNEFYAWQIAKAMGIDAIEYKIEEFKGVIGSSCKLFTDIDTAYVPMSYYLDEYNYDNVLKFFKEKKLSEDKFRSMLIFDCLIYNEDRHFNNFGMLRDNHCGDIWGMAPIFDNGISFFNHAKEADFEELDEYRAKLKSSRHILFDNLAREFGTKLQREQLKKLVGFKFEKHPLYNWDEARLKIIEEFLQKRVGELLKIIKE
ncbi:MAG: HipA domain-containing protein [Oscillospiraceae bacterium]|nr:HipA domain-containing protein [Oscillospiraceae bacterium]